MKKYKSIFLQEIFNRGSKPPKGKPKGDLNRGFIWIFPLENSNVTVKLMIEGLSAKVSPIEGTYYVSSISFQTKMEGGNFTYYNANNSEQFKVFSKVFAGVSYVYSTLMEPRRVYFNFAGVSDPEQTSRISRKTKNIKGLLKDHKFNIFFKKEFLDVVAREFSSVGNILSSNYIDRDIDRPTEDYLKLLKFVTGNLEEENEDVKSAYEVLLRNTSKLLINHTIEGFEPPREPNTEIVQAEKQVAIHSKDYQELIKIKLWMNNNECPVVFDNLPSEEDITKGNKRNNIYIAGAIKFGAENIYSAGASIIVGSEPLPVDAPERNNFRVQKETNISFFEDPSFYRLSLPEKLQTANCTLNKLLQMSKIYIKSKHNIVGKPLVIDSFNFGLLLVSKYGRDMTYDKQKRSYEDFSFDLLDTELNLKIYRNRKNFVNLFSTNLKSPTFNKILKDLNELKKNKQVSTIKFFDNLEGFLDA